MIREKVLFIGDTSNWSVLASDFLRTNFETVESIFWDYGERRPNTHEAWEGDRIFCFKSDLILSSDVLARASKSGINFHPSVPKFRGIGGYTYALMEGDEEFGATCHHMVPKIDAGQIIEVRRFPIVAGETPAGLSSRTAAHCLVLFLDIVGLISGGIELPLSDEKWGAKLYTRAMFNELTRKSYVADPQPAMASSGGRQQ